MNELETLAAGLFAIGVMLLIIGIIVDIRGTPVIPLYVLGVLFVIGAGICAVVDNEIGG